MILSLPISPLFLDDPARTLEHLDLPDWLGWVPQCLGKTDRNHQSVIPWRAHIIPNPWLVYHNIPQVLGIHQHSQHQIPDTAVDSLFGYSFVAQSRFKTSVFKLMPCDKANRKRSRFYQTWVAVTTQEGGLSCFIMGFTSLHLFLVDFWSSLTKNLCLPFVVYQSINLFPGSAFQGPNSHPKWHLLLLTTEQNKMMRIHWWNYPVAQSTIHFR